MFKTSHFVKAFWFALAAMIASAAYEITASVFPRLSRSYVDEIALCTGAAFILALVVLRRRDTDLLKLEKANFRALVEHLPGLTCIVDKNQKLARWNSRFQNILGYSATELREIFLLKASRKTTASLFRQSLGEPGKQVMPKWKPPGSPRAACGFPAI